jgi:hypothetical protein
LDEFNGETDQARLLIAWSTLTISLLMQQVKDRTAYAMRRQYWCASHFPDCGPNKVRPGKG